MKTPLQEKLSKLTEEELEAWINKIMKIKKVSRYEVLEMLKGNKPFEAGLVMCKLPPTKCKRKPFEPTKVVMGSQAEAVREC